MASGLQAAEQLAVAETVVTWASGLGLPLAEVNVGGGMHVDYAEPERRFDWVAYGRGLARLAERHPNLTLRIEPGRALTAYCGWYATEVLDVKHSHGEEFAVVRGGTHHLRTPATKGHDQPCSVLPVDAWPHPWPRPAAGGERSELGASPDAGRGRGTRPGSCARPRTRWPAGCPRSACGPGTGWRSHWRVPTRGTSPTTTSSCTPGPASTS